MLNIRAKVVTLESKESIGHLVFQLSDGQIDSLLKAKEYLANNGYAYIAMKNIEAVSNSRPVKDCVLMLKESGDVAVIGGCPLTGGWATKEIPIEVWSKSSESD